jgi:hypothetical protein
MKFYIAVLFLGLATTFALYGAVADQGDPWADQTCRTLPWLCQHPYRALVIAAAAAVILRMGEVFYKGS